MATTEQSGTRTRARASLRMKIGLTGLVGVLAAVLVGGVNLLVLAQVDRQTDTLSRLQALTEQIGEVRTANSDVTGWQVAYAWDTRIIGGPQAVAADSPNRAGYLASAQSLRDLLGTVDTDEMQPKELELWTTVTTQWDAFFAADDQVVAAYTAGDLDAGDAIVVGAAYDAYYAIGDATVALRDSVSARTAAAVDAVHATASRARLLSVLGVVLGAAGVIAAAWSVGRSLGRSLASLRGAVEAMAGGDLTVAPQVLSSDEIGVTAAALVVAQTRMREAIGDVAASAREVAGATRTLTDATVRVRAAAEENGSASGVVAAAAEQVSRNVQTVAAGAEQMGASIQEIAHNASSASAVSSQAADVVAETNRQITHLGEASQQIGAVVKTITSIAEQTNLLALNATIEAARAGEAGKGFAVVAGEVKDLAQETAKATDDIAAKVAAIQAETSSAVDAIGRISAIVAEVSTYQLTIASAVEEQSVTTAEMSRNVAEAATGSDQIAHSVVGIADGAAGAAVVVAQIDGTVADLSRLAQDLEQRVGRFRV